MSVYVTACGNMHSHIFTETDRNNEEVAILYMERSTRANLAIQLAGFLEPEATPGLLVCIQCCVAGCGEWDLENKYQNTW